MQLRSPFHPIVVSRTEAQHPKRRSKKSLHFESFLVSAFYRFRVPLGSELAELGQIWQPKKPWNRPSDLDAGNQGTPKMVRKRSQEGQEIQQSSSRRPGWHQEADFPAIVPRPWPNLDPTIKQKIKNNLKNHKIF